MGAANYISEEREERKGGFHMSDLSKGYEAALEAGEFDNDVSDEFSSASFTGEKSFTDDAPDLAPGEKEDWQKRMAEEGEEDRIEELKITEPRLFMPSMIPSNSFSLDFFSKDMQKLIVAYMSFKDNETTIFGHAEPFIFASESDTINGYESLIDAVTYSQQRGYPLYEDDIKDSGIHDFRPRLIYYLYEDFSCDSAPQSLKMKFFLGSYKGVAQEFQRLLQLYQDNIAISELLHIEDKYGQAPYSDFRKIHIEDDDAKDDDDTPF